VLYTRYPHFGAHTGFSQLVRFLDSERFDVRLQEVADDDSGLPLPLPFRRGLRARVQRDGMSWYKLSDLAAELRSFPGCVTERTDVVHYLDGEHSLQFLPRWLERIGRSKTRMVATFHQPAELLDKLVRRDVVAALDRALVVSPAQADWFRALLPPERVEVTLHGVDTAFFRPGERRANGGRVRCVTAGHWLRDWPAVRAVASALRDDARFEFDVITDRATGLEGLSNVRALHGLSDEELVCVYQNADILFLPLTGSTANNSLLEGIACGLPVISTDLESVRAYVPGREAVLVESNATEALLAAVRRLADDVDLRIRMGAAARARAEELAWSNVARRHEQIYGTLLRGDGASS
jgi:glycosyltransferase involved in cell wall biosynthesis